MKLSERERVREGDSQRNRKTVSPREKEDKLRKNPNMCATRAPECCVSQIFWKTQIPISTGSRQSFTGGMLYFTDMKLIIASCVGQLSRARLLGN